MTTAGARPHDSHDEEETMSKEQQNTRPVRKVDPIEYHPVVVALSKAHAAQFLLEHCNEMIVSDQMAKYRGWLEQIGHDALTAALAEAETAFRTSAAAPALRAEVVGGAA